MVNTEEVDAMTVEEVTLVIDKLWLKVQFIANQIGPRIKA
jgi:hypothetical protein